MHGRMIGILLQKKNICARTAERNCSEPELAAHGMGE